MVGAIRKGPNQLSGEFGYFETQYNKITHEKVEMAALCRNTAVASNTPAPLEIPRPALDPIPMIPKPEVRPSAPAHDSVPIKVSSNTVFIDVVLGGYPTRMVLDTGATRSVISYSLAQKIVQSGGGHWLGKSKSQIADGSIVEHWNIMIDEVRIGDHIIRNVPAEVQDQNNNSDMLLGFSTLNQIGAFTIDASKGELIFRTMELGVR